jgi:hypothetical protein
MTLIFKKIIVEESKEVKTGQIWQNLLRVSIAQKGLFCQWRRQPFCYVTWTCFLSYWVSCYSNTVEWRCYWSTCSIWVTCVPKSVVSAWNTGSTIRPAQTQATRFPWPLLYHCCASTRPVEDDWQNNVFFLLFPFHIYDLFPSSSLILFPFISFVCPTVIPLPHSSLHHFSSC